MRIAYFDCFSGISGDMTLGAMVDLGVPVDWLEETIKSALGLTRFSLASETVHRSGIAAKKIDVRVSDTADRDYAGIRKMIENSRLSARVAENSLSMFARLAAAEAQIHGCPVDEVHFHELGGVDAIVDMVGAALCIDQLGIEVVKASPIAVGSGTITCAHGRLPVPAPATAALLAGVPVYGTDIRTELATPTGAAIITTLAEDFDVLPDMVIEKTGYGAGQRDFKEQPNVLRIIIGAPAGHCAETMEMVETCIDDMNPEIFGYLTQRLYEDGAADVYLVPIHMKKGRPGTMVQVLCTRARQSAVIDRILMETSAIGVRHYSVKRHILARETVVVATPYGSVTAKRVRTPDGQTRVAPEYESCREIAAAQNQPIRLIYEAVLKHLESIGMP